MDLFLKYFKLILLPLIRLPIQILLPLPPTTMMNLASSNQTPKLPLFISI
jgi:hypothetical protein